MLDSIIATIDLSAIAQNIRALQRLLGKAELAAVIKADGYGLGMKEIAGVVHALGGRNFYTAHLSDAIEARRLFPDIRVAPLNGVPSGTEAETVAAGVTPIIADPGSLERFRAFAQKTGREIPVTLFVDTGMNRIGFEPRDWAKLGSDPGLLKGLVPATVMSHLACADEPQHDMNARQLAAFREAIRLFPGAKKSFANSPSIFLGADYHFDEARPGRALSGMRLAGIHDNPLVPALKLEAPILQLRLIDSDGTVGYGAAQRVRKGTRLATISAGYADGILRSFGNTGESRTHHFFLGGHAVPIVGRISMELTVVDVSAVPEHLAHPGAMVEIAGPSCDIDTRAAFAGTIGYELMTLIGPRVHRRYLPLQQPVTEPRRALQ